MSCSSAMPARRPGRAALPLLVLLAGLAVSFAFAYVVREAERRLNEAEFRQQASALANAVQDGVDRDVEILEAVSALFAAHPEAVSRAEFHAFAAPLLPHHRDIQALEWIPRVPDARRPEYELRARREGFPDFRFTERAAQGEMVPAAIRPEYFPVYFVEPLKRNETAVGFDLASNAARREAVDASRNSGETVATARITLVQETGAQFGFLIFQPMFRSGAAPAEKRPQDFIGFALGVFRIGDLVDYALRNSATEAATISLVDLAAPPAEQLLYRRPPEKAGEGGRARYAADIPVQVPGRRWSMHLESTPAFESAHGVRWAWVVQAAGLLATVLVAAYLRSLIGRNAEQQAHAAELDAANRRLEDEIAERKQAQEAIGRLNEELEAQVEERTRQLTEAQAELVRREKLAVLDKIAGSVGHELRNPLGIMGNAVFYLQTVLANADATTREYLGIIKDEVGIAEQIVSDLLDAVRTKAPMPETVPLRGLVESCMRKHPIPGTIALHVDIPPALAVRADPGQTRQMLHNLVGNAVDAMAAGGSLDIRAREAAGQVAITVADTGPGMTPEQVAKLFQPLFTTKVRGIGLGLVVVKNLTEANGGRLAVQSEPGKGTTFTLTLPGAGAA